MMRYLTIALTKGRLAKQTMKLLEQIGISCEEMNDPATRRLIFTDEARRLRFFLAKGPDVPTYVEYGAADIGVVGEDTIMEEDRKIYEVLDLGFGKCRMCVAGPESAEKLLNGQQQIRVATKYPKIARDYFNETKNQTVEIIKLKSLRGDCRYCRDRIDAEVQWTEGARGGLPAFCKSGCESGQYADGERADHCASQGNERGAHQGTGEGEAVFGSGCLIRRQKGFRQHRPGGQMLAAGGSGGNAAQEERDHENCQTG